MHWLLWLLVFFSTGVASADRAGAPSALVRSLGLGAGLLALVLGTAAAVRMAGAREALPSWHGTRWSPGGSVGLTRGAVLVLLALAAFAAGHDRHGRQLERARRGAALATAMDRGRVYLVDARVAARQTGGTRDEIELWDVRARGETDLPDRLLLALPRARSPDASRSRERHEAEAPIASRSRERLEAEALIASRRGKAVAASSVCDGTAPRDETADVRAERLLWPGARVRLAVRIGPLQGLRNPGSVDRSRVLARRGIGAQARLVDPDWVVETVPDRGRLAVAPSVDGLRRAWRARAAAALPACRPGAGLARALALGDRSGLDPEVRRRFGALGLAHLLSVSGLHVGFVAGPVGVAVSRLRALHRSGRRPILGFSAPLFAAALAGGSYAWLTGGNVPALRASGLFALMAASRGLRASPRPATVLGGIALMLLLAAPDRLFSTGARFSFVACAGLIAAGAWRASAAAVPESEAARTRALDPVPIRGASMSPVWAAPVTGTLAQAVRAIRAGRAWAGEGVRASLAVSLALLPWIEIEGMPRALPSPLLNLVAIPWAGLVVLPASLIVCALAVVAPADERWVPLLLAPAAGFEAVAEWVESALPEVVLGVDRAGRLPWSVGLVAIGGGFLALRRGCLAGAGAIWLAVGGLGLMPIPERGWAEARPRVVFLDVGQADAALLDAGDATWLIDSGPGAPDGSGGGGVLRALRALGVERLDGLVVSHGDLDHRGGALRLLAAMPVDRLWIPALDEPDPALERLARAARERGTRVERVFAGLHRASGQGLAFDVIWPPHPRCRSDARSLDSGAPGSCGAPGVPGREGLAGRTRNARSLVVVATLDGHKLLFSADVDRDVELRWLDRLGPSAFDVLKVGHHGSRTSSDPRLLARLGAKVAIVSAPCDATRGLPSAEVLLRLRGAGSVVGWTGRDGAVAVTWDALGDPIVARYATARDCERPRPRPDRGRGRAFDRLGSDRDRGLQ